MRKKSILFLSFVSENVLKEQDGQSPHLVGHSSHPFTCCYLSAITQNTAVSAVSPRILFSPNSATPSRHMRINYMNHSYFFKKMNAVNIRDWHEAYNVCLFFVVCVAVRWCGK